MSARLVRMGFFLFLCATTQAAIAQPAQQVASYPNRPVRLIVTLPPGGGVDLVARTIATKLGEEFRTPFVVDNRAGAGGIVGTDLVAKAQPDGYTLLWATSTYTIAPFLYKMPFDVKKDFAPITLVGTQRLLLVANAAVKASTVQELIALAKARPGELNIGLADPGGTATLAAELFKMVTATNMVSVAYKGTAPALTALVANEVQVSFATPAAVIPLFKAGRLKALATTGKNRASYLPDVPTLTESGVKDFNIAPILGVVAPAKTPTPIVEKLYGQIVSVLNMPSVREELVANGIDIVGNSPKEFAAFINGQLDTNSNIIKTAGLKGE